MYIIFRKNNLKKIHFMQLLTVPQVLDNIICVKDRGYNSLEVGGVTR